MNTYDDSDDLAFEGFGSHLFVTEGRFDSECGVLRFDPLTLRAHVADRPYDPFERHLPRLRFLAQDGPGVLRDLAIRLVRGMLMPELRDSLPYATVDALVEATEDALEPGRTSYNFGRLLERHRDEIVSAGLFDWLSGGVRKYAAPPLLAAACLLDDDPWVALRTAYNLAEWLDDVLSDGERDLLYAPDRASRIVEAFLAEHGFGF